MSYRISLTPSRRAAGRFIAKVRRALVTALAEEAAERGLTQADLARELGIDRSVINRQLRGRADISVGRIAELANAMGRVATIDIVKPDAAETSNSARRAPTVTRSLSTTSDTVAIRTAAGSRRLEAVCRLAAV